jgi:hypothetical protein
MRTIEARCTNSGAAAQVTVRITSRTSAPQARSIDLAIKVAGEHPCAVVLTPELAFAVARALDEIREKFQS